MTAPSLSDGARLVMRHLTSEERGRLLLPPSDLILAHIVSGEAVIQLPDGQQTRLGPGHLLFIPNMGRNKP